jgi:putative flippase GtrA
MAELPFIGPTLTRLLGAQRAAVAQEFLRFGVVGTIGFVVDSSVLYGAIGLGAGLYLGRAISYMAAATATWALNRAWTFRGRGGGPVHRQWALFVAVNLVGFALNYGTYAVMVATLPVVTANPILGVAAGSIAGMFTNFVLSRRVVFRG